MHEVLVNPLEKLPRKIVVRLTYRPDMTLDVYHGRKTTAQQQLGKTHFGPWVGWLVGFGLNGPLRQYFSLYRTASQRAGERGEKIAWGKNVQTTPVLLRPF